MISIITATYNAADLLPRLVQSLKAQTDTDFEWVVADGGSSDDTLNLLNEAKAELRDVKISSQPDFGIYDALNRAVRMSSGTYYIVLGADDTLDANAIANYKKSMVQTGADLITARVVSNGVSRGARTKPWSWLYGQFAFVSGHAVGLAIRRSLHDKVGWYSRKYPIAADQLFILKAIRRGASVSQQSFVAGGFDSVGGTSGQDVLGTLTEGFRVQIQTGQSLWLQLFLLMLRIIKNRKTIGIKK